MKIRNVGPDDRSASRRFRQVADQIYQEQPLWVPPLQSEIEFLFDRENHPFYESSDALFLLAERGGAARGRQPPRRFKLTGLSALQFTAWEIAKT